MSRASRRPTWIKPQFRSAKPIHDALVKPRSGRCHFQAVGGAKWRRLTKAKRGSFWYSVPTRVQLKALSSLMRGALKAFSLGTMRKKFG